MKLSELLKKRAEGLDLTPEELELLADYDASIAVQNSELSRLKAEKEEADIRLANADTELQTKLKILADREKELESERKRLADELKEKADMQKIIENAQSTEEARIQIEKAKADKKRAEDLEKAENEKAEALKKAEALREQEIAEKKKLEEELATVKLERLIMDEKVKRPYIVAQLDNILKEIPTKGHVESQMYLNVLLSLYNHDEEMAKYKDKQKDNTDIFSKPTFKEELVPPKAIDYSNTEDIIALAKKLGFKTRIPQK